jgi:hypothetical protein
MSRGNNSLLKITASWKLFVTTGTTKKKAARNIWKRKMPRYAPIFLIIP